MTESFALLYCDCVACRTPIAVNPAKCPSLRVNGVKQAICPSCFAKWNEIHRTNKGLEPIPLNPEAYAPCPEAELPA